MTFPIEMPARLLPAVAGCRWERATEGRSGGMVYRLEPNQGPPLYLKYGTGDAVDAIADEAARLEWLAARLTAPELRGFAREREKAWLFPTHPPQAVRSFSWSYLLLDG